MPYASCFVGSPNTPDYRVFISYNGHILSALHDIPLLPSPNSSSDDSLARDDASQLTLNMVVEAPRWSSAQMVIAPSEAFAPIRQEMRGRRLAYVRNCFPHRGFIWNYGALPQTWAEGAPLRVCELGERVAHVGDVRSVRVLGLLALRDEGILRHTLLVIDTADSLAARLHNIADIDRECPGLITATKEWFRLYKLPDGKAENTFELGGQVKGIEFVEEIVRAAHEGWRNIVTSSSSLIMDLSSVTIQNSPGLVRNEVADQYIGLVTAKEEESPPAPMPSSASKWWYIATV
ncbi:pyrophosphatase-domain-containing protein [Mycena maculata]|uniref:inorganic diphosphatase n=1 Tax=Mycena maculata TaxID=230809 RepID=A0AAD7NCY1_9AGAR|nr:pyrophosphatase-domain-containing protein [Mycena maculata]